MLRGAGLGVAMGNALPEVHAEADLVAGDHRGDAIARLIDERLLSRRRLPRRSAEAQASQSLCTAGPSGSSTVRYV